VYIPPELPPPPPAPNTPDLECSGSLSWTNIKPGATVSGYFQVQNIGDDNSLLNWTVNTSFIGWGTWTITPESGIHLTPAEGQINVHVSVIAPDEPDSEFDAYLRVENINNASDFELIPVILKTPANIIIPSWLTFIHQYLSHFLQNHVFLQRLWTSMF
jgi:hypothetical protein